MRGRNGLRKIQKKKKILREIQDKAREEKKAMEDKLTRKARDMEKQ